MVAAPECRTARCSRKLLNRGTFTGDSLRKHSVVFVGGGSKAKIVGAQMWSAVGGLCLPLLPLFLFRPICLVVVWLQPWAAVVGSCLFFAVGFCTWAVCHECYAAACFVMALKNVCNDCTLLCVFGLEEVYVLCQRLRGSSW